ncbi:MAG: HAMP domain-containing protein, partial [Bdellovibrionales bacterium]|nr:HAMP domain-containing protein [Bdellovibrionales bacterium]
ANIRKVNYVIVFTFISFLIFLTMMSYYFVREVISPIESLIKAAKNIQESRKADFIPNQSRTEIADLVDSFNEMSMQIIESDRKMKKQLDLLEQANTKIKNTQNQLVQSAKLASLGELVAGIAHELNNPIGFIYSNISHLKEYSQTLFKIIEKGADSPEAMKTAQDEDDFEYIKKDLPKLIQSCEEGANRAKNIVLGLRNFSRADQEESKPFNVNSGLDSTLQLLGGELKNRIEVVKEYHEVPMINANANQLKQVFMNIIANASQAITEGGQIRLRTQFLSDRRVVQIEIEDTGTGIDKDSIEKIFDPFYTTKAVGQGTGLGLSISYGIIKSHGGSINVRSEVGLGTTFTIELPVYRE